MSIRDFFFFSLNASNHRHNYLRCSEVLTRAYRSLSAWFSLSPRRLVITVGRLSFSQLKQNKLPLEKQGFHSSFPVSLIFWGPHQNEEFWAGNFRYFLAVGLAFVVSCTRHVVGSGRRLVVFFCRSIRLCA
jgi:hypothetical protein